jgi:hypothetical protein
MSDRNQAPIPGVPENLKELLAGDKKGYEIKTVYFVELKHNLWGFFPAIVKSDERVVVTTDQDLLQKVWKTLSPRSSKMNSNLYYVNEELGVGFPILGTSDSEQKRSTPDKLLTTQEFESMIAADPHPFEWAPGLIGNDMNREEFLRTIQAAAEESGVTLPA